MYHKSNSQSGFATSQVVAVVISILVILAIGGFVLSKQSSSGSNSSNLSGTVTCKISSDVTKFTRSTDSFSITYSVTNNSNQQVESKWYLTDIDASPTEGDISSNIEAGATISKTVDYSATPTKAFSAVVGAYANGGTVPGSATDSCKQIWQIN